MNYSRGATKAHGKANMTGIWAAALTPFTRDLRIDADGFQQNLRHWTTELGIAGVFVCGKQGEFFSMSVAERKHCLELAVEAVGAGAQTIMSCSDQNLDTVIDLARHASVQAPTTSWCTHRLCTSPPSTTRPCTATTRRSRITST